LSFGALLHVEIIDAESVHRGAKERRMRRRWLAWFLGLLFAPACHSSAGSPGAPSAAPSPPAGNPFEGARFYVDPGFAKKVEDTAAASPAEAAQLEKVAEQPTAVWIDSIATVGHVSKVLDDAKNRSGQPVVSVFAVYDLPNRDCAAKASAGELALESGGEERYKAEFIDKIAEQIAAHPGQRVVVILETDSVPNLVTNLDLPKCGAADAPFRRLLAYAAAKLSRAGAHVYLDAGHAGWLGWDGNRKKVVEIYRDILARAGGAQYIRGFFTNVSNYNVVLGDDNKKLEPSTPTPDELTYVQKLARSLADVGITGKGFIIDTGRNGRGGIRTAWSNWCNVKGAGLGERPRATPAPLVDAYFWIKTPGDSDGTSDPKAARFDKNCASPDAAPGAPEAGEWFASYFLELVKNAKPPITSK
jgi:cellulose 1,4-beta-cellobiosidase